MLIAGDAESKFDHSLVHVPVVLAHHTLHPGALPQLVAEQPAQVALHLQAGPCLRVQPATPAARQPALAWPVDMQLAAVTEVLPASCLEVTLAAALVANGALHEQVLHTFCCRCCCFVELACLLDRTGAYTGLLFCC
jgi:hypothetical protein